MLWSFFPGFLRKQFLWFEWRQPIISSIFVSITIPGFRCGHSKNWVLFEFWLITETQRRLLRTHGLKTQHIKMAFSVLLAILKIESAWKIKRNECLSQRVLKNQVDQLDLMYISNLFWIFSYLSYLQVILHNTSNHQLLIRQGYCIFCQ